jgi:hypothetical protein
MDTLGDRRVRQHVAREVLDEVLEWAFVRAEAILAAPADELDVFRYRVAHHLRLVAPMWRWIAHEIPAMAIEDVRTELGEAFARIRQLAQAIAAHQATPTVVMTVGLFVAHPDTDSDWRARWGALGRLRDGLIWMVFLLLVEVPPSLVRRCVFADCARVYVARKNQKHCPAHQRDAARQTQRRAERAFRARARRQRRASR